jgi:peptide/nickel transport system substrate-binding protein
MVVTIPVEPSTLLPIYINSLQGKEVTDFVLDHLAEIGDSLNIVGAEGFKPRLAERWTWAPDSMSIAFHLAPRARWHDGKPVSSKDVKFTFDINRDTTVGAHAQAELAFIDSVSTPDSLTATFWFKRRYNHQFFDAVYHLAIMPEHILGSIPKGDLRTSPYSRAPVGTGQFRFVSWETGSRLEVVADTANYRGRPKLDRVIFAFNPDPNAMYTRIMAGESDVAEPILNVAMLPQISSNANVKIYTAPGMDYGFLLFNHKDPSRRTRPHPLFGDKRMRQALTMAIDRSALTRSVFDTLALPSLGPMVRAQTLADTTVPQIGYDTTHAKALLDSLGWRDGNGDGIREKGGKPLRFSLIVPVSSRVRQALSVLLQAGFKTVGVQMDIESLEFNAIGPRLGPGNWDTFINAVHADPSPAGNRQTWGTAGAASRGGPNLGEYSNPLFDAHIDSAFASTDTGTERSHLRQAYETIVGDAPAIWLYEIRWSAAINKRIRPVGIRSDAWWGSVGEWSIPANERIDRDQIGLGAAKK